MGAVACNRRLGATNESPCVRNRRAARRKSEEFFRSLPPILQPGAPSATAAAGTTRASAHRAPAPPIPGAEVVHEAEVLEAAEHDLAEEQPLPDEEPRLATLVPSLPKDIPQAAAWAPEGADLSAASAPAALGSPAEEIAQAFAAGIPVKAVEEAAARGKAVLVAPRAELELAPPPHERGHWTHTYMAHEPGQAAEPHIPSEILEQELREAESPLAVRITARDVESSIQVGAARPCGVRPLPGGMRRLQLSVFASRAGPSVASHSGPRALHAPKKSNACASRGPQAQGGSARLEDRIRRPFFSGTHG